MVTLIHGNDNLSSRKYYISLYDENSVSFDAENINLNELSQLINGSGLFEKSKKIFIDNFYSRKAARNQTDIINILKDDNNSMIYIYSAKEVSIKTLSNIKNLEQKNFKLPQNLWNFLDGIRPNNPGNVFEFHKALAGNEAEIIFAMIVRQFRLLLASSTTSKNKITESSRLAPWQRSKLSSQASSFSQNSLKNIFKKLYKIDKSMKTGKSNLNLIQNIDLLLLEI